MLLQALGTQVCRERHKPKFLLPQNAHSRGRGRRGGRKMLRGLPAPAEWEEASRGPGTHKLLVPEASSLLGHTQKSWEPLMLWGLGSTFRGGPQVPILPPGLKTSPFVLSSWPVPPSPSRTRVPCTNDHTLLKARAMKSIKRGSSSDSPKGRLGSPVGAHWPSPGVGFLRMGVSWDGGKGSTALSHIGNTLR